MTMQVFSEMDQDIQEVLYSQEMLQEKVKEMGEAISRSAGQRAQRFRGIHGGSDAGDHHPCPD